METVILPDLSFPPTTEPWLARFCQNVQTSLQEMASALNNATQWQTGTTLASATTITVSSTVHCLTGNTTITTINRDTGGSGLAAVNSFLVLIPTAANVGLGTGGNIAASVTMTQNKAYLLVEKRLVEGTSRTDPYLPSSPVWYVVG